VLPTGCARSAWVRVTGCHSFRADHCVRRVKDFACPVRLAETFADEEIVSALRRLLSWTHIKTLTDSDVHREPGGQAVDQARIAYALGRCAP
jgi:hypothetical protein